MSELRHGFDEAAARVMEQVQGDSPQDHVNRCRNGLFWAIYHDGKPMGGILIERGLIHVSSLIPCGLQVRKVVRQYLSKHSVICAPIRPDNERARRLAHGLGFTAAGEIDGFLIYRRLAQ